MFRVNFFSEDIPFQLKHKKVLRDWIEQIVQQENHQLESLNYIFCSDDYLWEMNKEYLNHDTYTDIITFDNSIESSQVEGDIFISCDRVKENALNQNLTFDAELHRVLIHGALHLLGLNDKSALEKEVMREKEDACLSLLKL